MTPEAAFEKLIQTMLKKIPVSVTIGTVDSVDKEKGTCDVLRDGQPILHDVRLNAVIDTFKSQATLYPAKGSYVLCLNLGDATNWVVVANTEIEEAKIIVGKSSVEITKDDIVLNGGGLGGMVKISELTARLNMLVAKFNIHTHPVSGNITSTTAMQADKFNVSDYENKHVKQ